MPPDPSNETPLTVGGVPISTGPLAIVPKLPKPPRPPPQGRDGRFLPAPRGIPDELPDSPPPPPRPLLEQMHEEWVKLARRDAKIAYAAVRRSEAQFAITRADQDVRLRLKYLRQKAVETIQRRNGIRVIPGFSIPGGATKKDVLQMSEQLRKLILQQGFTVPPEIEPKPPDA